MKFLEKINKNKLAKVLYQKSFFIIFAFLFFILIAFNVYNNSNKNIKVSAQSGNVPWCGCLAVCSNNSTGTAGTDTVLVTGPTMGNFNCLDGVPEGFYLAENGTMTIQSSPFRSCIDWAREACQSRDKSIVSINSKNLVYRIHPRIVSGNLAILLPLNCTNNTVTCLNYYNDSNDITNRSELCSNCLSTTSFNTGVISIETIQGDSYASLNELNTLLDNSSVNLSVEYKTNFEKCVCAKNEYKQETREIQLVSQGEINCVQGNVPIEEKRNRCATELRRNCQLNGQNICQYYTKEEFNGLANLRISFTELLNLYQNMPKNLIDAKRCEIKWPDCPDGTDRLIDIIDKGKIDFASGVSNYGVSKSRIRGILRNHFANYKIPLELVCINRSIWEGGSLFLLGQTSETAPAMHTNGNFSASLRICPKDNTVSLTPEYYSILALGRAQSYGCCPKNYVFVGEDQSIDLWHAIENGACCPPGSSTYNSISGKCKTGSSDGPTPILAGPEKKGVAIGIDLFASGKAILSTDQNIYTYCTNESGCMLSIPEGQNIPTSISKNIVSENIQQTTATGVDFITKPNTLNQTNIASALKCNACFNKGDIIGVFDVDQGNTDNSKKAILRCAGDGKVEAFYLVNNSINDTINYIQTAKFLDAQNADLFLRCRERGGIYIFLGCIDTTPIGIVTALVRIALGTFGGIALLQFIYAGILYQLGDEEKLKKARQQLISTLTGIALLVFSVLLFRIIGVNILDVLPEGSI